MRSRDRVVVTSGNMFFLVSGLFGAGATRQAGCKKKPVLKIQYTEASCILFF